MGERVPSALLSFCLGLSPEEGWIFRETTSPVGGAGGLFRACASNDAQWSSALCSVPESRESADAASRLLCGIVRTRQSSATARASKYEGRCATGHPRSPAHSSNDRRVSCLRRRPPSGHKRSQGRLSARRLALLFYGS